METKGTIENVTKDLFSSDILITLKLNGADLRKIQPLTSEKVLDVELSLHREKRSKNANNLLWECIGRIGKSIGADKMEIYLRLLKSYGKFTYICVKPEAVEAVKKQWRDTEIIGNVVINGQSAVQLLCYFGSSTYNTEEMSHLLEGTISEMKQMGIETPEEEDIRLAVERWENEVNTSKR